MGKPHSLTTLLVAWEHGDPAALERLVPLVEDELRLVARRHMAREAPGHTLQPTALVNEAFLRLVEGRRIHWHDRAHFFAVAARLMRHVLVDHARAKRNLKRGGDRQRVPLTDAVLGSSLAARDIVDLDGALEALAAIDLRRSRVVELRFFGGLTVEETAAALGISVDTVMRDWKLARAWLRREMQTAAQHAR